MQRRRTAGAERGHRVPQACSSSKCQPCIVQHSAGAAGSRRAEGRTWCKERAEPNHVDLKEGRPEPAVLFGRQIGLRKSCELLLVILGRQRAADGIGHDRALRPRRDREGGKQRRSKRRKTPARCLPSFLLRNFCARIHSQHVRNAGRDDEEMRRESTEAGAPQTSMRVPCSNVSDASTTSSRRRAQRRCGMGTACSRRRRATLPRLLPPSMTSSLNELGLCCRKSSRKGSTGPFP